MKRETAFLIILSLLVNPVATTWGQDGELSEQDFQTLLEDSEAASAESTSSANAPTPYSSETVEIEELNKLDAAEGTPAESVSTPNMSTEVATEAPVEVPSETPMETPAQPPVETAESVETLEPLSTGDETESVTTTETADDLENLKTDLDEDQEFIPATTAGQPFETVKSEEPKEEPTPEPKVEEKEPAKLEAKVEEKKDTPSAPEVFEVGKEERELLSLAQNIQGQISDTEWNEVATATKVESYTVVKNDWLFKISKRLFGTGFFYPKIWSLNSFITNPHFIEPGTVLSFTTGSGANPPQVKLGTFTDSELSSEPGSTSLASGEDFANFGDEAKPKWFDEKKQLTDQGVYFQYASEETMDDLVKAGEQALTKEYESYEPPRNEFEVVIPQNYDKSGFDKNSKIFYSFKEGFYLSTFVSTNIVQDFGEITNGPDENIFFTIKDRAYVKFDESMNALPGDKYSVYTALGKARHKNSDREGYKYAIVGQIKLIRKIRDKWEVEFIEVAGTPQRGDRVTVYTPKIERITRTYNPRLVEAAILTTFQPNQTILGFGDVVYLDRGRADGVEMGNVFEVFGFKDRLMNENITDQPTYKMGELTVITLTDNFATALITRTVRDFYAGDIAITKTKEAYLREMQAKDAKSQSDKGLMGGKALEELDVELNLENLNDDLLKEADKIQLTEDELAELERQEREKSVIKDSERDLKALERLENEIEQAESILNDAKLDEDKLLENQNLNDIEKKGGNLEQDSLDDIEENLGKRYIDEDLNTKENPYGLNEFDIEEVDELLNIEKGQDQK